MQNYIPSKSLFFSLILFSVLVTSVSAQEYERIGGGSSPDVDINTDLNTSNIEAPNVSAPNIDTPNISAPNVSIPEAPSSEDSSNDVSAPAQGNPNKTVMAVIDGDTVLADAIWSDDQVTLIIETDRPKLATITDVNSMATTGASQVNFKRVTLASGRNEVTISPTMNRGSKTVTIAAGEGMIAVSNPSKPFFVGVSRTDVYLLPWIVGGEIVAFVLLLIGWKNFRLGKRMRRIG